MSLPRTSKDLNSCPSSALPQNLDKNINSFHIPYSNNLAALNNVNKEFLSKIPPKKFLPKKFSQKIPPKNILPKNSSQKIHTKISSQNIPKKIQKISKKFLKKFLRFWKYPIPYIALGGRKPFRACFIEYLTQNVIFHVKSHVTKHEFWGLLILKSQHPMLPNLTWNETWNNASLKKSGDYWIPTFSKGTLILKILTCQPRRIRNI